VWQIGGHYQGGILISNVLAPLLLDTYTDAGFAYSFRKLRNAYAGSAVRIRRSSDDAEANIGFDGSGNFDTAAASSHIGGGSGFIVTWYDQSGNSLDVTQSTAANQPAYDATGMSSLPTATFDGINDTLERASTNLFTTAGLANSTIGIMSVLDLGASTVANTVFQWTVSATNTLNTHIAGGAVGPDIFFDFGNNTDSINEGRLRGSDLTAGKHFYDWYRDSSNNQDVLLDGVSQVSGTRLAVLSSGSATLKIMADAANGKMSELVCWKADLGANRTNARTAINAYWTAF
jgi:hypothetical protein